MSGLVKNTLIHSEGEPWPCCLGRLVRGLRVLRDEEGAGVCQVDGHVGQQGQEKIVG